MPIPTPFHSRTAALCESIQLANGEIEKARSNISNADPKWTIIGLVGGAHLEHHFMREATNIRYLARIVTCIFAGREHILGAGLPELRAGSRLR